MSDMVNERVAEVEARRDARMIARLKAASAVFLLVLAAASFAAGVPGLLAAGEWARLGSLAWLTPIAIDGGLVFFSASAMAWRAETAKASVLGWTMVVVLTLVSVTSQVAHVLVDAPSPVLQDFVGAAVASMFPLLVLASTRQFEMLRFARLIEREAGRVIASDAMRTAEAQDRARTVRKNASGRKPVTTNSPSAGAGQSAPEGTTGGMPQSDATVTAWVRQQLIDGERPSGDAVARMLGKSRATGLRLVVRVADELHELDELGKGDSADDEAGSARRLELVQAAR